MYAVLQERFKLSLAKQALNTCESDRLTLIEEGFIIASLNDFAKRCFNVLKGSVTLASHDLPAGNLFTVENVLSGIFAKVFVPLYKSLSSYKQLTYLSVREHRRQADYGSCFRAERLKLRSSLTCNSTVLEVLKSSILICSCTTLSLALTKAAVFTGAERTRTVIRFLRSGLDTFAPFSQLFNRHAVLTFIISDTGLTDTHRYLFD